MQWYLTRYAELPNGGFELLTYDEMPNLEVAQLRAKTNLPNNEFYEVECHIGSLLPKSDKPCWVARKEYSHKPYVKELQIQAEINAQHILDTLDSDIFDAKKILSEMSLLKPLLIKAQYQVLLDAFMSKPCIIKILYESEEV